MSDIQRDIELEYDQMMNEIKSKYIPCEYCETVTVITRSNGNVYIEEYLDERCAVCFGRGLIRISNCP